MKEIIAPKRGVSISLLKLTEWRVKEGEMVDKGTVVATVEAEKATFDLEAECAGRLHILVDKGNEVAIGTVIGVILENAEQLESNTVLGGKAKALDYSTSMKRGSIPEPSEPQQAAATNAEMGIEIQASPAARRLAREHNIDLGKIKGSRSMGAISRADVERMILGGNNKVKENLGIQAKRAKKTIALNHMKKAIAEHMQRSLATTAQVTVMGELDASELKKMRNIYIAREAEVGIHITYTDVLVFLIARILRKHEAMNSSLLEGEIKIWEDINIGVATSIDDGLIVPVVKNADLKTLLEISYELKELVRKARHGSLLPEEFANGTFTITNVGSLGAGYRFETVVINLPEAAILGVGGITDRAVVRNDQVVIRPIMNYYLTYDHRIINGSDALKFINSVAQTFEKPELYLNASGL